MPVNISITPINKVAISPVANRLLKNSRSGTAVIAVDKVATIMTFNNFDSLFNIDRKSFLNLIRTASIVPI